MAKTKQRRFVRGKIYEVKGAKRDRRLKFRGHLKMGKREYLVFQPLKKISKIPSQEEA
jgi:hypothetical protein